jgi:hypothetical protein
MTAAVRRRLLLLWRWGCAPRSAPFRPQRFCGPAGHIFRLENALDAASFLLAAASPPPVQSTPRRRAAIETP